VTQGARDPLQDRQVRRRLAVLRHADEVSGNVPKTRRYYGISRQCYYAWLRRFEAEGPEGRILNRLDLNRLPASQRYQRRDRWCKHLRESPAGPPRPDRRQVHRSHPRHHAAPVHGHTR
jgi:hypothetical protein